VVPMVDTCARQASTPNSSAAVTSNERRIMADPSPAQLVCGLRTATLLPSARSTLGLRMT
jgi:hypothetical protein